MKRVLFIDRDGTILEEPADEQIDSFEKFRFLPGVITSLHFLRQHTDYELVMVSNQDGLGTASYPEEDFWPTHNLMLQVLESAGITFDAIHIDRSFPEDNLPTRKPGTAMLTDYMNGAYDMANSWVIGDRATDAQLAVNLGCKSLILNDQYNWERITEILFAGERTAEVVRKTHETDIRVWVNLDGNGKSQINTGLGFFDHMLEQIAKHGMIDLEITCHGDLHVTNTTPLRIPDWRWANACAKPSVTSAESNVMATACPWTIVCVRWLWTSVAVLGWFGMPCLNVRKWVRCPRKCSSISSRAFQIARS